MFGFFPRLLKSLVLMWRCILFMSMMEDEGGGAAEEDKEPWDSDVEYMTRPNTPLKRATRASPVWSMIRRLADDHPKTTEGYTHTCTHAGCGCFLTVPKVKGNWATTKCVNHIKTSHPSSDVAKDYLKTAQTATVTHSLHIPNSLRVKALIESPSPVPCSFLCTERTAGEARAVHVHQDDHPFGRPRHPCRGRLTAPQVPFRRL